MLSDSGAAFQRLHANLQMDEIDPRIAGGRIIEARAALRAEMGVLETVFAGSYSRQTMLPPLRFAKLDVVFVMDPRHFRPEGHVGTLEWAHDVFHKAYGDRAALSASGRAVTIRFPDYSLDAIPGFHREGGGYVIPDSATRRWLATNPARHADMWRDADSLHRGRLIPLLKMLKAWNRCNGSPLQSLHLEALAIDIYRSVKITDDESGVRYFFNRARAAVLDPLTDPAGLGGNLATYLDDTEKLSAAVKKLENAYASAVNAQQIEQLGKPEHAAREWLPVFGRYLQEPAIEGRAQG